MEKRGQQLTGQQRGHRVKAMWLLWGRVDRLLIRRYESGLLCLWFKTFECCLPLETRFPLFFTKNTISLTEKWNSYILDRGETHFKTSNKLFQKLLCFFSPLCIWFESLYAISTHHFTSWFYMIKENIQLNKYPGCVLSQSAHEGKT